MQKRQGRLACLFLWGLELKNGYLPGVAGALAGLVPSSRTEWVPLPLARM